MKMTQRIVLATIVLVVDLVLFFVPLTAMVLAYLIIFNPRWARDFFIRLDPSGP